MKAIVSNITLVQTDKNDRGHVPGVFALRAGGRLVTVTLDLANDLVAGFAERAEQQLAYAEAVSRRLAAAREELEQVAHELSYEEPAPAVPRGWDKV